MLAIKSDKRYRFKNFIKKTTMTKRVNFVRDGN